MDKRVKEVAKEDAERMKHLAMQAVQSRAFLYPFKACYCSYCSTWLHANLRQGIFFFATHRELWRPMIGRNQPPPQIEITDGDERAIGLCGATCLLLQNVDQRHLA